MHRAEGQSTGTSPKQLFSSSSSEKGDVYGGANTHQPPTPTVLQQHLSRGDPGDDLFLPPLQLAGHQGVRLNPTVPLPYNYFSESGLQSEGQSRPRSEGKNTRKGRYSLGSEDSYLFPKNGVRGRNINGTPSESRSGSGSGQGSKDSKESDSESSVGTSTTPLLQQHQKIKSYNYTTTPIKEETSGELQQDQCITLRLEGSASENDEDQESDSQITLHSSQPSSSSLEALRLQSQLNQRNIEQQAPIEPETIEPKVFNEAETWGEFFQRWGSNLTVVGARQLLWSVGLPTYKRQLVAWAIDRATKGPEWETARHYMGVSAVAYPITFQLVGLILDWYYSNQMEVAAEKFCIAIRKAIKSFTDEVNFKISDGELNQFCRDLEVQIIKELNELQEIDHLVLKKCIKTIKNNKETTVQSSNTIPELGADEQQPQAVPGMGELIQVLIDFILKDDSQNIKKSVLRQVLRNLNIDTRKVNTSKLLEGLKDSITTANAELKKAVKDLPYWGTTSSIALRMFSIASLGMLGAGAGYLGVLGKWAPTLLSFTNYCIDRDFLQRIIVLKSGIKKFYLAPTVMSGAGYVINQTLVNLAMSYFAPNSGQFASHLPYSEVWWQDLLRAVFNGTGETADQTLLDTLQIWWATRKAAADKKGTSEAATVDNADPSRSTSEEDDDLLISLTDSKHQGNEGDEVITFESPKNRRSKDSGDINGSMLTSQLKNSGEGGTPRKSANLTPRTYLAHSKASPRTSSDGLKASTSLDNSTPRNTSRRSSLVNSDSAADLQSLLSKSSEVERRAENNAPPSPENLAVAVEYGTKLEWGIITELFLGLHIVRDTVFMELLLGTGILDTLFPDMDWRLMAFIQALILGFLYPVLLGLATRAAWPYSSQAHTHGEMVR